MSKAVENYLDKNGKIKVLPSKQKKRRNVLSYLASKFQYNRIYNEKEVNEIISLYHSYNDYFILRRELIEHRFLRRTLDGSRYWKADLIPTQIETNRLLIRNSRLEDEIALIDVNRSCTYVDYYTGMNSKDENIHTMLTKGDLPPNGDKIFYQCKTILLKDTKRIIGYFDYYQGYPDYSTLWVSIFNIHKNDQKNGYGYEGMHAFTESIKICQFNKISIGVHLKNWQAIRFWVKNGFNQIEGIYGDREYNENSYSVMALTKVIR